MSGWFYRQIGFLAMTLRDFTCLEFLGKDKKIFMTPSFSVARVKWTWLKK